MDYLKVEIIRPLYVDVKKISAPTLKTGDRFMIDGDDNLWFKLAVQPENNRYLCSNEKGETKLLDGNFKVERIKGISFSLNFHSKEIVKHVRNH